MKILKAILICLSPLVGFTEEGERISDRNYFIISDEYSTAVPAGTCQVTGQATSKNWYNEESRDMPIVGANVATLDRTKSAFTDDKGNYNLLIKSSDTAIFFYMNQYEEIVIWKYNFRSQHKVVINFVPAWNESIDMPAKPVIYLYSEKELNAEIKFSCVGNLSFVYPEYNDRWQVNVSEKGIVDQHSGKVVPYLFWEAKNNHLKFIAENKSISGFMVSRDSLVDFFESSLSLMGLNSREQTDFITFWAPRMNSHPLYLIQFLIDESYEELVSQMTILPRPDSMLRMFMLFKPLDTKEIGFNIVPQQLPSFERSDFTVVEWGGSEITISNLIP